VGPLRGENSDRDSAAFLAVELEYAEVKALHGVVPRVEVHVEPDVTWVVHPESAWANAAVAIRFDPETVERRLDEILGRYRENGRGAGFWISPFSTPDDLPPRLKARGLHCRRRFAGMHCDFETLPAPPPPRLDLTLTPVEDYDPFVRHPHPFYGRMRTPKRRFALAAMARLATLEPRRIQDFVALRKGVPVGFISVFLGERGEGKSNVAGIHDVGVLPDLRKQGIGLALMHHAHAFAREQGYRGAVLIASAMGEGVYRRAGFREVGRIAYWYRQYHTL